MIWIWNGTGPFRNDDGDDDDRSWKNTITRYKLEVQMLFKTLETTITSFTTCCIMRQS